jgi:DNA-binding LacI/PurR family transcriptional regulator
MTENATKEKPAQLRYEEVAQQLRHQIHAKILLPGDRLPSLRMLRQKHGVTQATIDRAYSVLENEGLILRSQRSGIFVAQPHERPANGILGFCSISFFKINFTPYWTALIGGVEAAAHEAGTPVLLLNSDAAPGWEKVDGVLFNRFGAPLSAERIPHRMPVVALFALPAYTGTPKERERAMSQTTLVAVDDYGGMRSATEHLLSLGHRRIAFLNNSFSDTVAYPQRLAGYQDALKEAGVKPQKNWLRRLAPPTPELYFLNAGRDAMREWLHAGWRDLGCTALMAQNDDTACGAVQALREAGYQVPDDISVVGFDGAQSAEICEPLLTTVELPLERLGRAAVEILLRRIAGDEEQTEPIILPAQLRVGSSTCPPR